MVSPLSISGPLVEADPGLIPIRTSGRVRIVRVLRTGLPVVVGGLVIVPDGDPGQVLVTSGQVGIGPVLLVSQTIVVERGQFGLPEVGPVDRSTASPVFVDIITQMKSEVHVVSQRVDPRSSTEESTSTHT